MNNSKIFEFEQQLALGKLGEEKVFKYLNNLQETVNVLNLSQQKIFQGFGIDGLLVTDRGDGCSFVWTGFDIKTDFQFYKTGKLFIEIYADINTNKEGGILSSKAEFFYYYDPFGGFLFKLPLYPLRNWYNREGISMNHREIANNFGQLTTGVAISPEELNNSGVPITTEKIGHLNIENNG
jgi:hypothetical protein